MTNFSQYQGPVEEWEDFVKSTGFVQPPPQNVTPQTLRAQTNATRVTAAQANLKELGLLQKVTWQDFSIVTRDFQNILARVYKPKDASPNNLLPVYLYFHGGGHLFGNIETEDFSCARIVADYAGLGVIVVNVNYRHTPEFTWPTQFHDAWDSFEWLSTHISEIGGDPTQVVVGGISAGGGLAASVTLHHHELATSGQKSPTVNLRGQLLCSPWLLHPSASPFPSDPSSSFRHNQMAPVLPWSALSLFADLLGPAAPTDPKFNVALSTDEMIKGMPKTSLLIAGQDLLRDEALYYGDKLKANGVPIKVHVFPGLPHGFRRFTKLWSTNRWEELIVQSIQWCLSSDTTSSFAVESK